MVSLRLRFVYPWVTNKCDMQIFTHYYEPGVPTGSDAAM